MRGAISGRVKLLKKLASNTKSATPKQQAPNNLSSRQLKSNISRLRLRNPLIFSARWSDALMKHVETITNNRLRMITESEKSTTMSVSTS